MSIPVTWFLCPLIFPPVPLSVSDLGSCVVSARVSHPLLPQGVVGIDGAPGAKGNVVCVLPFDLKHFLMP